MVDTRGRKLFVVTMIAVLCVYGCSHLPKQNTLKNIISPPPPVTTPGLISDDRVREIARRFEQDGSVKEFVLALGPYNSRIPMTQQQPLVPPKLWDYCVRGQQAFEKAKDKRAFLKKFQ
jgi:hypothetical protein